MVIMKKELFFDRPDSCYFMDDAKAIAAYCKARWPEDVAALLESADNICEKTFLFNLKWDLERTFVPVHFDDKVDWHINPAGDQEFVWAFNRHRFFITLGQAYQFTGDEKYAQCFVQLAYDWMERVPLCEEDKMGPWRSLEAGFRGEYWNKALRYFKDSPAVTEEFLDKFYETMIVHAKYIISCDSPYRYMSNWGVIENHGLFDIALMLPQSEETRGFARIALEHLEAQARMQIMEDGMHWEQSPMYHNEVFHCFLDVVILCRRNGMEVPHALLERLARMAQANRKLVRPNNHELMMGDSDDVDVSDRMSEAAYLFMDGSLKPEAQKELDYSTIWDLGLAANEAYQKLAAKEPEYTSVLMPDSGHVVLRSGWDKDADMFHLMCGTLGAGHSHGDKLHIDLVMDGEDVLMDAGRFTYVDGEDRKQFKDPSSHNTVTVDGRPFYVYKDSWECSKLSAAVKPHYKKSGDFSYIEAGNLGYMDMPGGVFIRRRVISLAQKIYVLVDEMYTGDAHTYEQYFHFNPDGAVRADGENAFIYEGKKTKARFEFVSEGVSVSQGKSRLARYYNFCEENDMLKASCAGDGFISMITVISKDALDVSVEQLPVISALKRITYERRQAEALRITVGATGEEYVVSVCHEEVNSPTDLIEADGCLGYGNVIVFDKKKETLVGCVLDV